MYQVKITIDGITPPIWRLIQVPESYSLNKLHHIIQLAFGWTNSHLYCFLQDDVPTTDPHLWGGGETLWDKAVKLKDVLKQVGDSLPYEYDLGDSWRHTIVLVKIAEEGLKAPRCLDGARAAPPEDCGGIRGYIEMLDNLRHPERDGYFELLEWLGDEYDPERFDLEEVNQKLRGLSRYIKWFEEENDLGY